MDRWHSDEFVSMSSCCETHGAVACSDGIDPRYPNAAVALLVNEFLELIRLPLAITTVTRVSRLLKGK